MLTAEGLVANISWLGEQSWFKHALLPPTVSAELHPVEPKREWQKKDEQEWLRIWLAWNELAIPQTFWSETLEVLMEIEEDPSFRDGSPKVQWRQWLIIYKDVLKVP